MPSQPADNWQQHVKGIRHRRQLVSLRLTGQLGNMTVSLFEALPGEGTGSGMLPRLHHPQVAGTESLAHVSSRPEQAG